MTGSIELAEAIIDEWIDDELYNTNRQVFKKIRYDIARRVEQLLNQYQKSERLLTNDHQTTCNICHQYISEK